MRTSTITINIVAWALVAAGFVLMWPLSALGLLLLGITGRYAAAIAAGLLLDVAFGVPTGVLHTVYVPFTLLALTLSLLRYYFGGYFREDGRDTL